MTAQVPPSGVERTHPAGHRKEERHYLGCFLGGAVGDALGAAVEFDDMEAIRRKYGAAGILEPAEAFGRVGAITDDTQMTLFTAEGLIRALHRALGKGVASIENVVWYAYQRWLRTQGLRTATIPGPDGWLLGVRDLHASRAPGRTCLSALAASQRGEKGEALNHSKGCGGVMRIAPVGLAGERPFDLGCRLAGLTHGHPTGRIAAGLFAELISRLTDGAALPDAVDAALEIAAAESDGAETVAAVRRAVALAARSRGTPEDIESLGGGWTAEEAVAIAIYCALVAGDFAPGVRLAVNHPGDSDSTGSMTGNILGLIHGVEAIPRGWLDVLELRDVIAELARDFWWHFAAEPRAPCEDDEDCGQRTKYPGV